MKYVSLAAFLLIAAPALAEEPPITPPIPAQPDPHKKITLEVDQLQKVMDAARQEGWSQGRASIAAEAAQPALREIQRQLAPPPAEEKK